jgi:hypothetical protein
LLVRATGATGATDPTGATGPTGASDPLTAIGGNGADPRFIAGSGTTVGATGTSAGGRHHHGHTGGHGLDHHANGGQLATDLTNFGNVISSLTQGGAKQGSGSGSTTNTVLPGIGAPDHQDHGGNQGLKDLFGNHNPSGTG